MKPIFIVDGHSDYALRVFSEHKKGKKQILMDQYLPLLLDGNIKIVSIQVGGDFALYGVDWHDPINVYLTIGVISQEVSANSERFIIITSSDDFDNLFKGDKIGFLLSLEGASSINKDFSHLRNFYRLGLRALSITHNEKNLFADGLLVDKSGGLSELGVELINELNKLNFLLDLVHISEKGFFEALNIYKKTPIISHSNAKGIYDIYRNLTDEQILAVSNRDGVIGINFIGEYIGPQKDHVTVENLVDILTT